MHIPRGEMHEDLRDSCTEQVDWCVGYRLYWTEETGSDPPNGQMHQGNYSL